MGMDVYGKKPRSEVGKYFRASIWSWHPLWNYACAVAPDLISEELALQCATNDGYGLGNKASIALAGRLRQKLVTNEKPKPLPEYVQSFARMFGGSAEAATLDWSLVEEFASFLEDCGGFKVC